MTTLGTASANPGQIDTGRLEVGEARDGTPIGLPVCVINGVSEGKTLYIQAASDGDELNGVGVVQRFVPQVDPNDLAGTILLIGIVNYHGFLQATHRNPIDDTKLNRVYPGDEHGTSSERIAHATFEVAKQADLVIDLHQGSTSQMLNETRIRCGRRHRLHADCLEFAKAFGCGYVLDQKGPDGQLARAAADEGIPAIDPELGGAVGWNEESIAIGITGLKNVLNYYGLLDGEFTPERQIRATGFERYIAPVGGLVKRHVDLGDQVSSGEILFEITDIFGDVREQVNAESDGIFWRTRRLPQVATGEYVCSIGTDVDKY